MELHFVKNDLRFSSGIMFASLEKPKLLKPEFMRDTSVVQILRLLGQFLILFLFYERYFKHLKHKQKHLSNIQPNISKQKST